MKEKYIPTRKCICCQNRASKYELIRIIKTDDSFAVDANNSLSGRGAYVCRKNECISVLEKRSAVARAFKTKVSTQQYEKLTEELEKYDSGR